MGICASWISIVGLPKAEVLDRLQVVETGEVRNQDLWFNHNEVGIAELPSGRVLLLSWNNWEIDAEIARTLSVGAEAVVGHLEEHVMHSAAYGFRNGRKWWSVVYDPDQDTYGVSAKGPVPRELNAWLEETDRNSRLARRGGDYLDLPVRLAAEIGRYRPDQDLDRWRPEFSLVDNPSQLSGALDGTPPLWLLLLQHHPLKQDAEKARYRSQVAAEHKARAAAKMKSDAVWKATGGFVGAVKRVFGGR
jgi:hypothetical protein